MTNYIDSEKFLAWYDERAAAPAANKQKLLDEVLRQYVRTRRSEYVLAAENSKSGREETYPIRFENIGCCGASTYFVYF